MTTNLFDNIALLIKLLKPFDTIPSDRNKGHISYSNMAIWLMLYEMLDDKEKKECINKIAFYNTDDDTPVEKIIHVATQHIRLLLENYDTGIKIDTNQKRVVSNLNFSLLAFLQEKKFLNIERQHNNSNFFSITMEQTFQFQWRKNGIPLDIYSAFYGDKKHDFLEFKTKEYEAFVLDYKSIKWLVVSKIVYINNGDTDCVLFFTPLISEYDWDAILPCELVNIFNKRDNLFTLAENKNLLLENNVLQETHVHDCDDDITSCLIPNLANKNVGTKLSTTSLTIFSPLFENQTINGLSFQTIKLDCLFLIKYDERGGSFTNKIRICGTDGGSRRSKKAFRIVINKPFILCYQHKDDVYCFTIHTISDNLINHVTDESLVF